MVKIWNYMCTKSIIVSFIFVILSEFVFLTIDLYELLNSVIE